MFMELKDTNVNLQCTILFQHCLAIDILSFQLYILVTSYNSTKMAVSASRIVRTSSFSQKETYMFCLTTMESF